MCLDLLHVTTVGDQEGGAGMAQIVEAKLERKASHEDCRSKMPLIEVPVADGPTLGGCEDVSVRGTVVPNVFAKHLGEESWDRDRACAPGLDRADNEATSYLRHRLHNVERATEQL
jgi:hypothetical protein